MFKLGWTLAISVTVCSTVLLSCRQRENNSSMAGALTPDTTDENVINSEGTEADFKSVFTTEYMVVVFASRGCQFCTKFVDNMNKNSDAPKIFSGTGKCKFMMALSGSSFEGWIESVGKETFVGKNSYAHKKGINAFGKIFGMPNVAATPTFILVNSKREILKKSVGESKVFADEIDAICK
ncbi:MAG: hypothetical protein NT027_06925 [Proteobacteria bacterium]|nr:hypothetical protein [Pseudomonadota bacterium]